MTHTVNLNKEEIEFFLKKVNSLLTIYQNDEKVLPEQLAKWEGLKAKYPEQNVDGFHDRRIANVQQSLEALPGKTAFFKNLAGKLNNALGEKQDAVAG